MSESKLIRELVGKAPNRRSFVKKLGIAGALAGAAAKTGLAQSGTTRSGSTVTDADVVQFALNLEYLEAEFYTIATTGKRLSDLGFTLTGSGSQGPVTGGAQVSFTNTTTAAVAQNLTFDEQHHVVVLQNALNSMGIAPIAEPSINLDALGFGFSNQSDFLKLARIFEDIGSSAYAGSAPLLTNPTVIATAARILAVEGFHVGNIRLQLATQGIATAPPLDGADVLPPPSGPLYFNVDNNGLANVRTPQQVLYLAYGMAANATSGGFFPNGVNGSVNMSGAAATSDNATLTANPNPVTVATGTLDGQTTLTWNAPSAQTVEIHVNSPTGPLFARGNSSGSAQTGVWVNNGMTFYLQDVSNGNTPSAQNTLATLTISVTGSSSTSL